MPSTRASTQLRTLLWRSHVALLAAQALLVPVSLALAAAAPFGMVQPEELAFFERAGAGELAQSAQRALASPAARWLVFVAAVALATLPGVVALRAIARAGAEAVDEAFVRDLLRFTRRFALLPVFMLPMGPLDMWVCLVWGRMVATGDGNPYYEPPTEAALDGMPLAPFDHFSPYGPVATWIDAAVAFAANGNLLAQVLLHKAALAAAWLATLAAIARVLASAPPARRAQAIVTFGWLPCCWLYWIGEGHNDGFMVALLVGWLAMLEERRHAAGLPLLLASVAAKYATAPFLALELWAAARMPREQRARYALAVALSLAAFALAFAPFVRDANFLVPLTSQESWRILTPSHALKTLALWTTGANLRWRIADALVAAPLLVAIAIAGVRFLRDARAATAARVVLLALVFASVVGMHRTWPWYVTWLAPVAVLVEPGFASRAVLAFQLVGPGLSLLWLGSGWESSSAVAVAVYALWIPAVAYVRRAELARSWISG